MSMKKYILLLFVSANILAYLCLVVNYFLLIAQHRFTKHTVINIIPKKIKNPEPAGYLSIKSNIVILSPPNIHLKPKSINHKTPICQLMNPWQSNNKIRTCDFLDDVINHL